MAVGIQAQTNERRQTNDGMIPAQFKTDEMQHLEQINVQPQSPICCFLQNTIQYPEECAESFEEGEVAVQFIIEKDGGIRDIEIVNSVSRKLDYQVVTCLQKTDGKWNPAMVDGQPIDTERKLYVIFDVEGNSTHTEKAELFCKRGMKLINRAELMETEDDLMQGSQNKKTIRLYNKAIDQFNHAARYKAEQASYAFWQSFAYEKIGDMSKMKEKLDEFEKLVSSEQDVNKEYVTIGYKINKK